MVEIVERYCNYETSKQLDANGFTYPCMAAYRTMDEDDNLLDTPEFFIPNDGEEFDFFAPTLAVAREWLASVKNIYIDVAVDGVEAYRKSIDSPKIGRIRWSALVYVYRDGEWYMMSFEDGIGYDYNRLLESHIRHALDYLNGKEGCFEMPISMR